MKEVVEIKDFLGRVEVLISIWLIHLLSSCIFVGFLVDMNIILVVYEDKKEDYGWQGQNKPFLPWIIQSWCHTISFPGLFPGLGSF